MIQAGLWLAAILTAASPGADGPGVITTFAGTGSKGFSGDGGPARDAALNNPFDLAFDGSGNLYLSDTFNQRIRRVDAKTDVITTVAGNGRKGFAGDGGPATEAALDEPYGVVVGKSGDLYFADRLNRRVRKVAGTSGVITTLAGDGSKTFSGDGGPAASAGLVEPNGVALDPSENRLFIADVADHRVRVVELGSGVITTFAGTGKAAHSGDGGPARLAGIFGARAVEVRADNTVFILERQGNTVRAVEPVRGVIDTFAGSGVKGKAGDGGPARVATFNGPKELAVDRAGHMYIVDTENEVVRRVEARTGLLGNVAGSYQRGGSGDGGPATSAKLARPHGVAVGPDGAIYIGDTENHRVRKVTPARP